MLRLDLLRVWFSFHVELMCRFAVELLLMCVGVDVDVVDLVLM